MTKRQAILASNVLRDLRPHIVKNLGPKWDSFHVEYSAPYENDKGEVIEARVVAR